jgi:hypothetical protein
MGEVALGSMTGRRDWRTGVGRCSLSFSGKPLQNLPEQRFVLLRKWYREFRRKWVYTNTTSQV